MITKYITCCSLIASMFFCFNLKVEAQANPRHKKNKNAASFRVVGYLRTADIAAGNAVNFDFGRLTHLNIAFLNPDSTGVFNTFTGIKEVVNAAHAKNVKVLASIGGGLSPAYYHKLIADSSRASFIGNLIGLVKLYNLDGIDVDLEGQLIDANYENFVVALKTAIKLNNNLLTAAIATAYCTQYTDTALAQYDFMNIMSYDKTGPWNPDNGGQHAPYLMAVDDVNYWETTRGLAKEKLTLGVPFYGYGFGTGVPAEISFKDLINQYPSGSELSDQITSASGGTLYYNGTATIKAKTILALDKTSGVMMWELMQDDPGKFSLLNVIQAEIKKRYK